jgi:two-component system response regulator YesN
MGYLTGLRIERAKVLLRDGVRPVSQVAFQIGFAHPHHFSRVFKARTGSAPARFR